MATYTLLFVLGSYLLGAFQLVLGVAVGIWVRRPDRAAYEREKNDLQQAGAIANRLRTVASEMSSIVGEHRSELENATRLLANDVIKSDETIAELVAKVLGEMVHSNQSLQSKLDAAEGRLLEQAVEIESHISRSLTDALTGLPNRREFNQRLEERMAAWNRRREPFSLLLVDVDHFKKLNDQYGHLAGDQVLAGIGSALKSAIRREDAVARFGGEEFALLLPSAQLDQAAVVARKIRDAVTHTKVAYNEHEIAATVSIGIAMIQPNETPEALIHRADSALYAAKAAGRNCVFAHDGGNCRPTDGSTELQQQPPRSALAELIYSDNLASSADDAKDSAKPSSGSPAEGISAALAETCQELRRFLQERGLVSDASANAPRAVQR